MTRDHLIGPLLLATYVAAVGLAAMGATCIITDPASTAGLGWLRWTALTIGALAAIWTGAVLATTRPRPDPFPPTEPTPPHWVNDGSPR